MHNIYILWLKRNHVGKNNVLAICVIQAKGTGVGGFPNDLKLIRLVVALSRKFTDRVVKINRYVLPSADFGVRLYKASGSVGTYFPSYVWDSIWPWLTVITSLDSSDKSIICMGGPDYRREPCPQLNLKKLSPGWRRTA